MGKKCSGALKNTSHLGQKDARDKRARGNDGIHREWQLCVARSRRANPLKRFIMVTQSSRCRTMYSPEAWQVYQRRRFAS
jgi:hypothetical protein